MKTKNIVFFCLTVVFWSCASSPTSPENKEFQTDTGINLTYVKRGLYSVAHQYKDTASREVYNKLLVNQIVYKTNEEQKELASYSVDGENIVITINRFYTNFSDSEKFVLLVGITSTIGLLNFNDSVLNNDKIIDRFYEVIQSYVDSGYNISNLINHDLYKDKKFEIVTNGIQFEALLDQ